MAKITLRVLADELQVSKSLVSKVLNGRKVGVSDSVRERILAAAERYNYSPNRMAVSLADKKSQIIGCIIPNVYFDYFSQLSYWIERSARECGYNVLMCNADENDALEREYLRLYQTSVVDGLIVVPCDDHSNLDLYQAMARDSFPFVFMDRYVNGVGASLVSTDHKEAFYYLTKLLILRGHRRILYIGHSLSTASSVQTERYRGYARAMVEAGYDEQTINIMADIDIENHLLSAIMSLPADKRPSALVMISSQDIRPILMICRKNGYTIPGDIEIASIDEMKIPFTTAEDLELSRVVREPMILLKQQPEVLAREAVGLLVKQMAGGNMKPVTRLIHATHNGRELSPEGGKA